MHADRKIRGTMGDLRTHTNTTSPGRTYIRLAGALGAHVVTSRDVIDQLHVIGPA